MELREGDAPTGGYFLWKDYIMPNFLCVVCAYMLASKIGYHATYSKSSSEAYLTFACAPSYYCCEANDICYY